jgi:hypothetical protein
VPTAANVIDKTRKNRFILLPPGGRKCQREARSSTSIDGKFSIDQACPICEQDAHNGKNASSPTIWRVMQRRTLTKINVSHIGGTICLCFRKRAGNAY